ncbi:hypothetical protein [Pseudoalteromonas sp. TB64]|uniref:hypothetical protein n=1 Tax=Pseudoalteromonas sp. TB64 TaxID=1938600 RepID=UPI0004666B47|nr:hypothetical protein [Pseudoalteromonas sp. TB64]
MGNIHKPLTEFFKAAPLDAIPSQLNNRGKPNQSYTFLCLMLDEQLKLGYLSVERVFDVFTSDGRSPRQRLEGDRYKHWLIDRVKEPNTGKIIGYKLNERHLLNDPQQDIEARKIRRKEFKEDSFDLAVKGRKRESKAYTEMTEATKDYLKSLGSAANDSIFKK